MARLEASDGPYLQWLAKARKRVGERAWDKLMDMPSAHADAWLVAHGILPFDESVEGVRLKRAVEEGRKESLYTFVRIEGVYDLTSGLDGVERTRGVGDDVPYHDGRSVSDQILSG
jgi:hypothetical protein